MLIDKVLPQPSFETWGARSRSDVDYNGDASVSGILMSRRSVLGRKYYKIVTVLGVKLVWSLRYIDYSFFSGP